MDIQSGVLWINMEWMSISFNIGVSREEVTNIARGVNCSYGFLPFTYLGLPVSKDMNRIEAWSDISNKFTKKLLSWKANLLSIGGRLTLVKAVLGNDENKMVWIRWQKILSSKKDGGLGVGSIKAKNMGLMGKWKWRFYNKTEALWRKVIFKIHGLHGGFDSRGSSRSENIHGGTLSTVAWVSTVLITCLITWWLEKLIMERIHLSGAITGLASAVLKDTDFLAYLPLRRTKIVRYRIDGLLWIVFGSLCGHGGDNPAVDPREMFLPLQTF
nr:RNA-directed DNA polymerase, eukaryota, reverse transcriptase zinc-binding domain protein [Tanacetum cinerariifolium]GEZ36970.1 RNA-directed DNA polymerase, eukaryota, reverse transcriptase zinc-binding domain protein [Tanacetum cinerariifolium]